MADDVIFTDNSLQIIGKLEQIAEQFLTEASAEIQTEAVRNTPADQGQLRGNWEYEINKSNKTAYVGNPLEYAIYVEMGTGEFAVNGDGRKTPWSYQDRFGNWHTTSGQQPKRMLHNAFETKKALIKKRAEDLLKGI